ncbi:VOC family protein [Aestuariivirga litoralis]|uniref:VOC family protein n=1 Tax=Aestuariivirga litoralis TaxID=2650924 RepID=UPI0018C59DFA|nr:VOC family protein [Aestuariivirga litoralis]MBG1233558.1 VOC family protein [Aestuariivirga litoralis]
MPVSARRIDHLVLAVNDLDAAGAFYQSLGFQVGARNMHPWGTHNRIVQFGSSFLELITVGDAASIPEHRPEHFSFGAFVRDYLAQREGLAMFVLDSVDAKGDAAAFRSAGIGPYEPFFFERKAKRPDGSETQVAFTLAFTTQPDFPNAAFFRCQQHFPENFWNPKFQQHPNGATGIRRVTLQDNGEHSHFLTAFTDVAPEGDVYQFEKNGELKVDRGAAGFSGFTISGVKAAAVDAFGTRISFEA